MTQAFRSQIDMTPPLLADAVVELQDTVRLILSTPEIYAVRRIVLFGSGDSHIAPLAAEAFIERFAGVETIVQPAAVVSRELAVAWPQDWLRTSLFIAISNSGEAARVVEATLRLRKRGARVLALTANPESRLGKAASGIIPLPSFALPRSPGYVTFLVMVMTLQMLALRLGEVRMAITMDAAQAFRGRQKQAVLTLAAVQAGLASFIPEAAARLADKRTLEFIGAGRTGFAMARFGAAKMMEGAGLHAEAADLEEWAHLNYFIADPEATPTILLWPGAGTRDDRAREIAGYLQTLRRPLVVIGKTGGLPTDAYVIPIEVPEDFGPLLIAAPLAMLAAEIARRTGATHGRGNAGPWADSADARTVQASTVSEELTP